MPIALDSPPRRVEASLRQRQANSRSDSKHAIARITRCPTRTEVEPRAGFTREAVIEPCALSTRMFIIGNMAQRPFSSLTSVLLLLQNAQGTACRTLMGNLRVRAPLNGVVSTMLAS